MKLIAYSFSFLGLVAILVGIGLFAHDYFYKTPSASAGDGNDLIRFLAWAFGGIIVLTVGIYLLGVQKRKTP